MRTRFRSPLALLHFLRARTIGGSLMAKAVYEPLDKEEQSCLDHLCSKYPELAKEQERFAVFADKFQLPSEELPFDLTTRIHALMEEPTEKRHFRATAYVTIAAVAMLLVSINLVLFLPDNPSGVAEREYQVQIPPPAPEVATPEIKLAAAMNQACGLVADSDLTGGAALLEQAIDEAPEAPFVGEALLLLGDIEYNYLQRYERAYAAYDKLRQEYPEVFAASQEGTTRYNLLSEVRPENYGPLYILDFARTRTANAFLIYEKIVASYPDTALANAAMDEMCSLVKGANPGVKMNMADELEQVRARCSNPVAVAQVDLTLGHHYCNALNDRDRARAYYNLAAASDHIALAHEATEALSRMK